MSSEINLNSPRASNSQLSGIKHISFNLYTTENVD